MKILVLGHARHGKDTVAEMLRDDHGLSFQSSSHFLADTVVRPALVAHGLTYPDLETCYADRTNHRPLWKQIIAEHNAADPARLSKAILAVADIYVGMRYSVEFQHSRHLFHHVLWVDARARGVPLEGRDSFDIDYDPLMLLVDNNHDLGHLRAEVAYAAQVMGLLRSKGCQAVPQ